MNTLEGNQRVKVADFQMKPTAAKLLRITQIVMLTCHLFVKEQVCKLYDIGLPSSVFIFQTHLRYFLVIFRAKMNPHPCQIL
jgi:hypothetical protein